MKYKIGIEDLVVLQYTPINNLYVEVIAADKVKDKSFSIDLENKVWTYEHWENIKIGERRGYSYPNSSDKCEVGIIGVYDRTKISDLNAMVITANEAVKRDSCCLDD